MHLPHDYGHPKNQLIVRLEVYALKFLGKIAVVGQVVICTVAVGQSSSAAAPSGRMLPGAAQISDEATRVRSTTILPGALSDAGRIPSSVTEPQMGLPGTSQILAVRLRVEDPGVMLPGTSHS